MKKYQILLTALGILFFAACGNNQSKQQPTKVSSEEETPTTTMETKQVFDPSSLGEEPLLAIETTDGVIIVKLYKDTPKHRDNFIKLASEGFYNGVIFHRVIKDFMIQTGDPDSKNPTQGARYGMGGPGYTIPAEILPRYRHKKGTLAAARRGSNNPNKESSGSQFYIVHNAGGTPHLDGDYTVFGEVVKGLEVVDKIALTATNSAERPVRDIFIVGIKPV